MKQVAPRELQGLSRGLSYKQVASNQAGSLCEVNSKHALSGFAERQGAGNALKVWGHCFKSPVRLVDELFDRFKLQVTDFTNQMAVRL